MVLRSPDPGLSGPIAAGLERLCEWAAEVADVPLPDRVRRRAALVLADDLAAIVVAAREGQVRNGQAVLLRDGGRAEATVFAEGASRVPRSLAAAANGLAVTWAELDEGYRHVPCHAGAYVLPALLAEAEATDAPAERVLAALAVAYEVTARIARTFPFPTLTVHPHGAFNAVGAAAGLATLRGYDARLLRDTLTASCTLVAPGPFSHAIEGALVRNVWTSLGATAGFRAADLAPLGIAGLPGAPWDVFVAGFGCDARPEELDRSLPGPETGGWAIEDGYHKLYACCQYIHSAVEAGLELAGRAESRGREVVAIEVETHARGLALVGDAPETVLAAKFSVPHAMAAVAALRTAGARGFEAATLTDPAIARLRRQVTLRLHPEVGPFPLDRPARVHWLLDDGSRLTASCDNARGGADQPFGEDELFAKFDDLTGATFPAAGALLRGLVEGREGGGWRNLVGRLTVAAPQADAGRDAA